MTIMNTNRLLYLDFLRIIGVFGVVLLHGSLQLAGTNSNETKTIGCLYTSLCLFCVPIFLMISGALLLPESITSSTGVFYKKRLSRLMIPLLFWSVVYYLLHCYLSGTPIYVPTFFKRLFSGVWDGPLWFMYMLLATYFIMPFLAPAFEDDRPGSSMVFLGLSLAVSILNLLIGFLWDKDINHDFTRSLIPFYFVYCVAGRLIAKAPPPTRTRELYVLLVFLASTLATFVGALYIANDSRRHPNVFMVYTQPFVLVSAMSLFYLARGVDFSRYKIIENSIKYLSPLTFGIFLVHHMVAMLLSGEIPFFSTARIVIERFPVTTWVAPLLSTSLNFIISSALVFILRVIPLIQKTI